MTCKTHVLSVSPFITVLGILILLAAPVRLTGGGQLLATSVVSTPMDASTPLFLSAVTYNSGGQAAMSVAIADVNGDGKPDAVAANACPVNGCSNAGALGVLLGNGDGTFQPAATYGSGGVTAYGLGSVSIGDVNGDGRPDIVVTNACGVDTNCTSGSIGVLRGNGDGTFQPPVTYGSGGYFDIALALADLNADGHPDVVVVNDCADIACASDGVVGVLLGNGDGSFQTAARYDSGGLNARSVAVADVNNDGMPDLLVSNDCNVNCAAGVVAVLKGNGDGTFLPAVAFDANDSHRKSVAVADVNGDGRPDMLVANYCLPGNACGGGGAGGVDVLLGNGDGTFQPAVSYASGSDDADSVAIADVNGDGRRDLLVINQCSDINCTSGTVGVLLGNGDGTFQAATTYGSGGYFADSIAIADLNGDGSPDLLVANFGNSIGVLLNNSADTTPPTITVSAAPGVLWPPNGKMIPVTISGTITDTGSGVNLNRVAYAVKDEYGVVQPHGGVVLGSEGGYTFSIWLQASRRSTDRDGRRYVVTVQAEDNGRNIGSKTTVVTVPHDHNN